MLCSYRKAFSWVGEKDTFLKCPGLLSRVAPLPQPITVIHVPRVRDSHEAGLLRPEFRPGVL